MLKMKKFKKIGIVFLAISVLLTSMLSTVSVSAAGTNVYEDRFLELWGELHDPSNGYFSQEGVPYHSIETIMCEAPNYGHETTSEAFSYYIWLEAMYGKLSGDWSSYNTAWDITERYAIPSSQDQPSIARYNPGSPATYAGEYETPNQYPSRLDSGVSVGTDPINGELYNAYGSYDMYGMHWLFDVDNFFGYGNRGDGTSRVGYINTFQRGPQEGAFEVVTHPSWEAFKWGGRNGFLDLFTIDNSYAQQWRYTIASDADARAVQATYWANKWAKEQNKGSEVANTVKKASKMGDYLRYSMFDKYFKPIGIGSGSPSSTGQHYLLSWYYAWGGDASSQASWAWKIGSSHNHFGYQNPMAAWILSKDAEFKPKSANGASDWDKSLQRQLEFYTWLQSAEGAIAGGATNSLNGRYETYPAGTSTFYGMAYDWKPVYEDPPSNQWIGMQGWSMQRIAELYYETNNQMAKNLLDKWSAWIISETRLNSDGTFEIPATLQWSGQPTTWVPGSTTWNNPNLHVTVSEYGTDLGIAGSLANTLAFYAAAKEKYDTPNNAAKTVAKELLDRMWNLYRDDKGIAVEESRADYSRMLTQEIYIPSGWTGKMADGTVIKSGIKWIELHAKIKQDPDWPRVEAALLAGEAPTFTYHRFWAQADIAIANAVYGMLFTEEVDEKLLGDLNDDGNINSTDFALLKMYLLDSERVSINTVNADMNEDGNINSTDFALLKIYILQS